ncbi:class III chitinase ChiA2 [Talaromyces proteolyticus]|uniref:Class III chitinase ChiA2 n=1 Tax=Talaromyces proteolyticus TaxID=1131652 RepID=A0AAD4Q1U1_9EURO|nr:class III chitinase ChiA2 [Talaromyces proteolyticus]KAH8699059.1 class III chitinase ChiA2 [Talaromyces proteolyticus]
MHLSKIASGLGLLASVASAVPHAKVAARSNSTSTPQTVVYWGTNGAGATENNDLSTYCENNAGIDVIVLSFLYEFGNGQEIPSGVIGNSCFVSTTGAPQECDNVAQSIPKCQEAGIKVILSLGGASSSYTLTSQAEAESIGQYLWESYGGSGNTTVERPFGNATVDGWDFDIELSEGQQYYQYMISKLRSNFASDSSKTYYITGAPQCPVPEPNMGVIIGNATFDYIWIQFYNNNNYAPDPCSLGYNGGAPFNYNDWVKYIADTPSKDAKLFVGVPASTLGANGNTGGAEYYITPAELATLVSQTKGNSTFGGVMMWDAGYSDSNTNNGCTYAQESHSILTTGSPC